MNRNLTIKPESWPLKTTFNISRGAKKTAEVVVVQITEGDLIGSGECVPYGRYGESQAQVIEDIQAVAPQIKSGLTRQDLQTLLPAGAARNAVDCALWQLEAHKQGHSFSELFGWNRFCPVRTAQTVSLDKTEQMADAARKIGDGLIKMKLGDENVCESIRAVRAASPGAQIIIDANEAWSISQLADFMPTLVESKVDLIEQPLPQANDSELAQFKSPIPICADESCHSLEGIEELSQRYDAINIKLDKTGGLTEALKLRAVAEDLGLTIMLGCMVCTSLSIAPVFALTQGVELIDIDGPLWLEKDRPGGCQFDGFRMHPPARMF